MISIYLDNYCYNRPYDNQSQLKVHLEAEAKLYIQKMVTDKKLRLVVSYLSEYENLRNPHISRKQTISNFYKNAEVFVDTSNFDMAELKAAEIMKTGIKKMDALHIAAAIIGKADYFITTDIRVLKYKSNEIEIINPMDFIRIMEV